MKRYTMAYVLWLTAVIAMGLFALEWYRRVERLGWAEVMDKLRGTETDTETTTSADDH